MLQPKKATLYKFRYGFYWQFAG